MTSQYVTKKENSVFLGKCVASIVTARGYFLGSSFPISVVDKQTIIYGNYDGTLCKLNVPEMLNTKHQTHQITKWVSEPKECIGCCAILSDKIIVTGSHDKKLKLWTIPQNKSEDFKCEMSLEGHSYHVNCCAILPDKRLVSCSFGELKIWNICLHDLSLSKCELSLKTHQDNDDDNWIKCCAVLPDGRIIIGGDDKLLTIYKIQKNDNGVEEIVLDLVLKGHTSFVNCCAVLPDGKIISGSNDNTLKIWNINQSSIHDKEISCDLTLRGHTKEVACCSVLPDGCVVSGSVDKTLKIWNLKNGKCKSTLQTGNTDVRSCAVLPDGSIVTVSGDSIVKIWN